MFSILLPPETQFHLQFCIVLSYQVLLSYQLNLQGQLGALSIHHKQLEAFPIKKARTL